MPHNKESYLVEARKKYTPKLPKSLRKGALSVKINMGSPTESIKDQELVSKHFPKTYGVPIVKFDNTDASTPSKPLNVGVVLSGGQAPGGHNVIAGIFDSIKHIHPDGKLLGFLNGPGGLVSGKFIEIDSKLMDEYRNSGGFDMIGSGRTKLESTDQFDECIEVVKKNNLNTIIIIGGDDSNTNAAILAEYFSSKNIDCAVVGCPKTIDGDLRNEHVELPFGFDTAVKTYAGLIGNISRDSNSAKKYWHFIKLMGRSASHIGLEVALQTHPNIAIISEEVEEKKMTLQQVVDYITDIIEQRSTQRGTDFGIALIPEGLLEFIPECRKMIDELNDAIANNSEEMDSAKGVYTKVITISQYITSESSNLLKSLPESIQGQLLLDRDPHGNVQVSLIETEKLLMAMVDQALNSRKSYSGKFKPIAHFFGYEGRCAVPSNFDADYAYALGYGAAILGYNKLTGYMSSISNLKEGVDNWVAGGIPTSMLMNIEKRHGQDKPVIQKALVELNGRAFKEFVANRDSWAITESYRYPGPIQYFGPSEICDSITATLLLS